MESIQEEFDPVSLHDRAGLHNQLALDDAQLLESKQQHIFVGVILAEGIVMIDQLKFAQLFLLLIFVQLNDKTRRAANEALLDLLVTFHHLILLHLTVID